jgi:hypothetical protein
MEGATLAASWLPKGFEFLSGFPEHVRRGRVLLVLQAFLDDSGTKGTGARMVLAGLMGEAQVCAAVADEWARVLRANYPGRIGHFKMDDACGFTGEFSHWREDNRDHKVRQMASVIDRDDLTALGVVLDLGAFARVLGPWETTRGKHAMRHPYMMMFLHLLPAAVSAAVENGGTKPMELFFDNQDVFRRTILDGYDELLSIEDDPARKAVMPIMPWFRDDKEFVLLQAADLIAGELRLLAEPGAPPFIGELCPKLQRSNHFYSLGEDDMRAIDAHIRQGVMKPDGEA